jgi:hypothetical protein
MCELRCSRIHPVRAVVGGKLFAVRSPETSYAYPLPVCRSGTHGLPKRMSELGFFTVLHTLFGFYFERAGIV